MAKKRAKPQKAPSPAALSATDLARLLTKAGSKTIRVAMIREDIAAGAPQIPDGTLHLVQYTAWLARRAQ